MCDFVFCGPICQCFYPHLHDRDLAMACLGASWSKRNFRLHGKMVCGMHRLAPLPERKHVRAGVMTLTFLNVHPNPIHLSMNCPAGGGAMTRGQSPLSRPKYVRAVSIHDEHFSVASTGSP